MATDAPHEDVFSFSMSDHAVDGAPAARIVHLRGELDVASVPTLRAMLDELLVVGPAQLVVVDLTDLTFMDSSGLGALVGAHKKARVLKRTLRVVCPPGMVRRVIEITGLHHVLATEESIDRAVAR